MNDADVAFIHDPDGNVHYWKLRSLPAINYLGTEHATYPTSWRQLKHTWQHERGVDNTTSPGMIITLAGNTASSVRGPLCRHDELL